MVNKRLSQRLQTILTLVDQDAVVADVGADHGLLSLSLLQGGIAQKVYAIENKKGPLAILESAIKESQYHHLIETRLADGITNLPSDVTTIVIAGMGGDLISQILERGTSFLQSKPTLILEPNNQASSVRYKLRELGYIITNEVTVYEKTYYTIIKAEKGLGNYSEQELEFGPVSLKKNDKIFFKMLSKQKTTIASLLELPISSKRRKELLQELERINGYVQNCKNTPRIG